MVTFNDVVAAGKVTQEDAFAVFDSLPAVEIDNITTGLWKGDSFPPGAGPDDKLVQSGWYGKEFKGENEVNPLVFHKDGGSGERFVAKPVKVMAMVAQGIRPPAQQSECETQGPDARLRAIRHRGVVTASMVYNEMPIIDHFRQVDEDTLLGVMDNILRPGPSYFFVLRRQGGAKATI